MASEGALSRLRDSLSQLGQLEFHRDRRTPALTESMDTGAWPESPSNQKSREREKKTDRPAIALSKALKTCQERCNELEQKRNEIANELRVIEDDRSRLSLAMGRAEKENRNLHDEIEMKIEEITNLKGETRIANETLLEVEQKSRDRISDLESQRVRLERHSEEQKNRIASLENSLSQGKLEYENSKNTIEQLTTGMWDVLGEKAECMTFISQMMQTMQALFYNPTPFLDQSRNDRKCHGGHSKRRMEVRDGVGELRDVLDQLEDEIAEASCAYNQFLQRLNAKEDEFKRMLILKPAHSKEQTQIAETVLVPEFGRSSFRSIDPTSMNDQKNNDSDYYSQAMGLNSLKSNHGVRPFTASSTSLRRSHKTRMEKSSGSIDWAAELEEFQHVTCIMETKFSQLMKLKTVMQSREVANQRQPKVRPRTVGSLNPSRSVSRSGLR